MELDKSFLESARCELAENSPDFDVRFNVMNPNEPIIPTPKSKKPVSISKESLDDIIPKSKIITKCPCVIQSGKRKGEVCGKSISNNGKCSMHQKTCVPPKSPEHQPSPRPKSKTPERPVSPTRTPKQPSKCPCIIQSGKRKGEVCGRNIKKNGKCSFHITSCIEPVVVDPKLFIRSQVSQTELENLVKDLETKSSEETIIFTQQELDDLLEEVKSEDSNKTAKSIKSTEEPSEPTGKNIGFTEQELDDLLEEIESEDSNKTAKSIKSTEEPSEPTGKNIGFTEQELDDLLEEIESDTDILDAIDKELENEKENNLIKIDAENEIDVTNDKEWSSHRITEKEFFKILENIKIVDIDMKQMKLLESEIHKCFL